jgi:hypothetical protein
MKPPDPIDFHAAAVARASTFEQRGTDRNFLACWIPEAQLVAAFESAMRRHGDPEKWWDMLSID